MNIAGLLAVFLAITTHAGVVNIGADGSSLEIPQPWEISGPRFCPPGSVPLHAYRQKEVEVNLCYMGKSSRSSKRLLRELWESYQRDDARLTRVAYPGEVQRIGGGIAIHHFTRNVPPGFILPDHGAVMDAFFKRGDETYFYVVVKPLAARNMKALDPELAAFEKTAKAGFEVLENIRWPALKTGDANRRSP